MSGYKVVKVGDLQFNKMVSVHVVLESGLSYAEAVEKVNWLNKINTGACGSSCRFAVE